MAAPKAQTKMTRSNWSKANRPNKSHDLNTSQKVTVMVRYGAKSIGQYATTYMSRDQAAVPALEKVGIVPHDVDVAVDAGVVGQEDISRQSTGALQAERLFDSGHAALSKSALEAKLDRFQEAQDKGHTPIIQVISFETDYLKEQGLLKADVVPKKGLVAQSLDDSKLRIAVQHAVDKMAKQAGFSQLEYVGAIHGNTEHPHVHLAMIETDDAATGRLAAREISEQEVADGIEKELLGKSPAALKYDQENNKQDTVERGMMRQSELDYFRQEIDGSLTNMSRLVNVRDLERQEAYAASVNQDVLRKARFNQEFVSDFVQLNKSIEMPLKSGVKVTQALDIRVEKLSRKLLSGADFGQKDYMQAQSHLGKKLGQEKSLEYELTIHEKDLPSRQEKRELEKLGLDEKDYNGAVLTPDEFLEKHPESNQRTFTAYQKQYVNFSKEPKLENAEGLVLHDPVRLEDPKFEAKFLREADQRLVDLTKSSIYQMLIEANGKSEEDVAKGLKKSLASLRPSPEDLKTKIESPDYIKDFQNRLKYAGVPVEMQDADLAKIVVDAENASSKAAMPTELTKAQDLLQSEYDLHLSDLAAMVKDSRGQELDDEEQIAQLKKNQALREVTLGTGDVTKAGSMLHAALAAEVGQTGELQRLDELEDADKNQLFADYRKQTFDKMGQIAVAVEDLNQGVSFGESAMQQSLRSNLTDTLQDMAKGYQNRLDFVEKIDEISQLPKGKEQEMAAQLALEQALWRQGIDEGQTSFEIKDQIKEQRGLSVEDKLATAMTLHLKESQAEMAEQTKQARLLTDTMVDEKDFDSSKALEKHVIRHDLNTIEEGMTVRFDDEVEDVIYNPADYKLIINQEEKLTPEVEPKDLTDQEKLALSLNKMTFKEGTTLQKENAGDLEKERLQSQQIKDREILVDQAIAEKYQEDLTKDLYNKEQELGNISDDELRRQTDELLAYQEVLMAKRQRLELDEEEDRIKTREMQPVHHEKKHHTPKKDTGISR